ncbi:N-acetylneuraminate synthase [Halonotius pteroides]|uniref:N-acetylneuraminate synthase n=1 Tax=Halonotius pteroides TaxID=268735 RepID=A0A3A6QBD0_9EURY|nr:N-acetylneuraminate synthase [Halonotius pteroides]RJX47970.1 N-acetylneuraminate synthase [Halonotius pteroides]
MELDGVTLAADSVYFIAEAGVNHNGGIETAEELIDVAVESGADAVKFQTFSADRLVTKDAVKAEYQTETTGEGSQYEMLKRYELDRSAHKRLMAYCDDRNITFLSTPFDPESADMLADLGVPAIKLGSGELDNHPLLEHVAGLDLPMIVSTGMGTMDEVHAAHDAIRSVAPDASVVFLHCTSAYPCSVDKVNLRAMETMIDELDTPVGYSDHTTLPETPALAVAAGATVVEKHFTLDSTLPGPDHEASLEPAELDRAVEMTRIASRLRGDAEKQPTNIELDNSSTIRKSLHASVDIPAGTRLNENHIDILRPATGISPVFYKDLLGTETVAAVQQGNPLTNRHVPMRVVESDADR